jgi:hypothetical protein
LLLFGTALIAAGWILEETGYASDVLLQVGSTLLLVAPLLSIERQLSRVTDELADLRKRTQGIALTYEQLRVDETSGPSRSAKMTRVIREARAEARHGGHSKNEVAELFAKGSSGERITALGLMQGDIALTSVDAIVDGIQRSRSAFEQYEALKLAVEAWDTLSETNRGRVIAAVERELGPGGYITDGTNRIGMARELQRRAGVGAA